MNHFDIHRIVAGAIYDFAGFLTVQKEELKLGSMHDCVPLVDALTRWAEIRNLYVLDADLQNWNQWLSRVTSIDS